ncbi:hypothetical protein HPB52_007109 [Rhipicephalus sanguineus]|uniref:Uncharacterized protein n=1 Tax=Rhipicephalus sanguineus TaxID=34632 RepID=A0A9D4PMW3_RHISA|nr:hypothetical protein HPB52_007109 [Rhipicephalus sanguineus]
MMQYAVEGEELDPAELEDGTWVTPKTTQGGLDPLDLQHKYRTAASKPPEAMSEQASTPAPDVQAARPPQLPRRRPMPRLPSEHYKIVIRPRHPINLSNIGLATLLEAIQNSAKVEPARAEEEDQIRIHPIKNTLTVSTPDRIRAEAYRSLEVLRSQRYNMNLPVATYVPAPDDSIRGVVYKAYTDETDHDLQAELMKKNPDIPIVNARRLGSSRHLVITFAGHKLPSTMRFSNKQQQERLEQRPTKERGLEHRRSRANQQSGNYSARIQRRTRGQDQEPVNIPDSRRPFQIQFEIKDSTTGQISRQRAAARYAGEEKFASALAGSVHGLVNEKKTGLQRCDATD